MIIEHLHYLGSRLRRSRLSRTYPWVLEAVRPAWHRVFARISRRGLSTHVNGDVFRLDVRFGSPYGRHDPREYELAFYQAFVSAVRPGMHVLDIGADIGIFALAAAQRVQHGRVYAFEPNRDRADVIRRHLVLNRCQNRAQVVDAAVSDADGRVPFFASEWTMAGSLSRTNAAELPHEAVAETMVDAVTVDGFCERAGITPLVLKIDAEGAELRILHGAERLLRRSSPIVFCEVHPEHMIEFGSTYRELEAFVSQLGYVTDPIGSPVHAGIFHVRIARS